MYPVVQEVKISNTSATYLCPQFFLIHTPPDPDVPSGIGSPMGSILRFQRMFYD
jgi:hypothetical protein